MKKVAIQGTLGSYHDIICNFRQRHILQLMAAEGNAAGCNIPIPGNQLCHRRLAGAGRPYQGGHGSGAVSYTHLDVYKRQRYGKEHLEQTFLRKNPLTILYVRSHLRLVVNLQTNVKAMQSPAYAHRVKLSNLQQMANTIIYVQEHGFDTQSDLKNTLLAAKQELKEMQTQVAQHRSDLRILNDQIRYTGQYYANKEVYSQFSKAKYKGKYWKEHAKEIQKYEEARNWLRSFYQDGKMTSLKTLTLQKEKLQQQIASEEEAISSLKEKLKDLDTADQNVDAILQMQIPEPVKSKTKDLER